MVYPYLTFDTEIWGEANKGVTDKMCILQKRAVRYIGAAHYLGHSLPIFKRLHILTFTDLHEPHIVKLIYLFHHDIPPTPIRECSLPYCQTRFDD